MLVISLLGCYCGRLGRRTDGPFVSRLSERSTRAPTHYRGWMGAAEREDGGVFSPGCGGVEVGSFPVEADALGSVLLNGE